MYRHDAQIMEDVQHYEQLLQTYRRRLHERELQAANYGIDAPPHVSVEIENLNRQIFMCEQKISELNHLLLAYQSVPQAKRSVFGYRNIRFYIKLLVISITVILLVGAGIAVRNLLLLNRSSIVSSPNLDAKAFLDSYYFQLNNREYAKAFSMLSDNFKRESHCCKPDGSYDDTTYVGFWDTITKVEFSNITILNKSPDYVTVSTTLHYIRTDTSEVYSDVDISFILDKAVNQWFIDKVNTKLNR